MGVPLQYATEEMRDDPKIVTKALCQNPWAQSLMASHDVQAQ